MMAVALAVLALQPVLPDGADLRLVALGVGAEEVTWLLDGEPVATSRDREAVTVAAGAGVHRLEARTPHGGPWMAVARVETQGVGLEYVPSWAASTPGHAPPPAPGAAPWLPWPAFPAVALVAASLLARGHAKGP